MGVSVNKLSAFEAALADRLVPRAHSMLKDLARWVSIPTGMNHTGGLDEQRGLLTERVARLGAKVELVEGKPKPGWLHGAGAGPIPPVAVCRRTRPGRPAILIACHIDTVFEPEGAFQELIVSQDRQRGVGPGVVDMKGGVLIAINALEALEDAGAEVSWTLVLTSDEETGSYMSDHILAHEARQHKIGIVTEPALPGGELAIERMGSGQFQIEAHGRSAHVGRAFAEGISAVTALAEAIVKVGEMANPARGHILNIGPIVGANASNIVPDLARAWGNVRYPSREIADEIGAMLDTLVLNPAPTPAEAAHHGEAPDAEEHALPQIIVRQSLNRPAKPLTPEVEQLALAARGAAESLGQKLPFAKTGGVCDGNILQAAGLPTIDTLGVRGGGLHTTQEWIELASLVERSQLMAVLLHRLSESGEVE